MAQGPEDTYLAFLTEGISALDHYVRTSPSRTPDDEQAAKERWHLFLRSLQDKRRARTALHIVVQRCKLDASSIQILLLALAHELSAPDSTETPSYRHAIELLSMIHEDRTEVLSAIEPTAPLRKFGLVEIDGPHSAKPWLERPLFLSAPARSFLLGEPGPSLSIASVADLNWPECGIDDVAVDRRQVERARILLGQHPEFRRLVSSSTFDGRLPQSVGIALIIAGPSGCGKTLLVHALAADQGRPVLHVDAPAVLRHERFESLLPDLFTEAHLRDALLVFDRCEALPPSGRVSHSILRHLDVFEGAVVFCTSEPSSLDPALGRVSALKIQLGQPDAAQRLSIFRGHLPSALPLSSDVDLVTLSEVYDLSGAAIQRAVRFATSLAMSERSETFAIEMRHLVEGCEAQLGDTLDQLAVRTQTHLTLNDVVLPPKTRQQVDDIISAISHRALVMERWGFGRRLVTGKGVTALFDGPPGTGKTLVAEIIAAEFDRAIYRVDVPEVVSKWLGETEKNLKAIFQRARIANAILLFDEADSLFGARTSEVKSAMDRFANMEVNLILQEIERFPGICILTTNFVSALDDALRRRIQFRVTFSEPDAEQRAQIWKVLCPPELPLEVDVDFVSLGRDFELTGGLIKNAFLRAAYGAARTGKPLTQALLRAACVAECRAAGKVTREFEAERPASVSIGPGARRPTL